MITLKKLALLVLSLFGGLAAHRLYAQSVGDRVQTTAVSFIFASAGGGRPTGMRAAGDLGVLIGGPQLGPTGNLYWPVDFDTGMDGYVTNVLVAVLPSPPALLAPGRNTSPGPVTNTLSPVLSWTLSRGATRYGIVVDDLTAAINVYSDDSVPNVSQLSPPVAFIAGHQYRWTARAFDSVGGSSYANYFYFIAQPPLPPAPQPLAPGSATSPGPTLATLTPTLTWNETTNVTGYGISFDDLTSNTTAYRNNALPKTNSWTLPTGVLTSGHRYLWYLRGVNEAGIGTNSTALFVQAPVIPQLSLKSLANGVLLTWPTNAVGFTLEASSTLPTGPWTQAGPVPVVVNTNFVVTNSPSGARAYYRLRSPIP